MSVAVRQAGPADVARAAPLFDAYRSFYAQPPDLARAHDWLAQRVAQGEATLLLAERDGRTVGFTLLYPGWSSVSTGRVLVLNDLYVDPSARRAGVASALLRAAAQAGRDQGALRLVLETARGNLAAQALYVREGWTAEATQWFHLPLDPR
jgi:GNAT superfamily N-acetyltransferase